MKRQHFAADFGGPLANGRKECFGRLAIVGNDPEVARQIAALREAYQDNIQQMPLPQHIGPGILDRAAGSLVGACPFSFDVIEQRSFMHERAFFSARESLQIKRVGFAFDDDLFRMQLRQLAPDVVRDVVVRFFESILDKVLYAHNSARANHARALRLTRFPRDGANSSGKRVSSLSYSCESIHSSPINAVAPYPPSPDETDQHPVVTLPCARYACDIDGRYR